MWYWKRRNFYDLTTKVLFALYSNIEATAQIPRKKITCQNKSKKKTENISLLAVGLVQLTNIYQAKNDKCMLENVRINIDTKHNKTSFKTKWKYADWNLK